ncbi:unnamed protein product [Alopecurus aequalis]
MSRSAPLVLSRKVFAADLLGLDEPMPGHPPSRPLSCLSRRAIGVNSSDDANHALTELCFDTHLADAPALSRLTLGGARVRYMSILGIDCKLIVLGSRLPVGGSHVSSQVYFVYDAIQQSIAMISSYPWTRMPQRPGEMRDTAFAMSVLIAGAPGGDGRRYALVNMAETTIYSGHKHTSVDKHDVLYIWRSWCPRWSMITTRFPAEFKGDNVDHSYTTVLAFSCGGRAFWVNLLRGAMYCSLDALLSTSATVPRPKFGFISLPAKLPSEIPGNLMCAYEMCSHMFRTMGRAGESSIKFVTIDGFLQHLDFVDCILRVWSLSPEISLTDWTERSLCLGSLVKQACFKKAGLPTDMVPMYPSLNPGEDNVIYFMLGKYGVCCNMHSKSKQMCNGHVTTAHTPLYQLRVDMSRGVLLGAARLPEETSPSVILADTSVVPSPMIQTADTSMVPSPMIQTGSTLGRKGKRRRGALIYTE